MNITPFPRKFKTYLPFIVFVAILTAFLPRASKFDRDYRKGSPWGYETLVAEFEFPVLKTDDQVSEELYSSDSEIVPYYRFSSDVEKSCIQALSSAPLGEADSLRADIVFAFRKVFDRGILSDERFANMNGKSQVSEEIIYIQRDKRASKYPVSDVLSLDEARSAVLEEIKMRYGELPVDSVLSSAGVYEMLKANLLLDRQTTQMIYEGQSKDVSPTRGYVTAGTVIVQQGEIVTAEIAQVIDSYKREYNTNHGSDKPAVASFGLNFLIAVFLAALIFFIIYFEEPHIFKKTGKLCFIVFNSLLAALPILLMNFVDIPEIILLIPFTLAATYLQAFFENRIVIPLYLTALLPLALFVPQGATLYVMYALAGLVAVRMYLVFNRGLGQFVTSFVVFLVLSVSFLTFKYADLISGITLRSLVNLFIGSLLSVAAYQLVYFFEKVFNLLSVSRLAELADTNSELLHQLEMKAPGTFQHSLQVMRLADAAARAIDANMYLIRVGALYHDIGKMKNPQCFVENESLLAGPDAPKYHSDLTAQQSAHDITRHVTDGLDLAEKYGLPRVVQGFIATHHGTGRVNYFYNQYVNAGGDPGNDEDFIYKGSKPKKKEQVILMLSDSIEAASRTLRDYSPESFDRFVESIVDGKITEGQLSEAEITIKELNIIKDVFKGYLAQIYHERVAYPKRNR